MSPLKFDHFCNPRPDFTPSDLSTKAGGPAHPRRRRGGGSRAGLRSARGGGQAGGYAGALRGRSPARV